MNRVLAIDPGFRQIRIGSYVYENQDKELDDAKISVETCKPCEDPFSRYEKSRGLPDIVVIPGGCYRPSESGSYRLSESIARDAAQIDSWHPRNRVTVMAYRYCTEKGIPGVVVEPMHSAKLSDEALFSGYRDYKRRGVFYALPQREAWACAAREAGLSLEKMRGVSVYLGDEVSVSAHCGTRVVDTSDPVKGEGPFGFNSAGTLPAIGFLSFMAGKGSDGKLLTNLKSKAGLRAYAGVAAKDVETLISFAEKGEQNILRAISGMAYQVSKEIGRQVCALRGCIDTIVLCGPLASVDVLVEGIKMRVSKWAKVLVIAQDLVLPCLIREGIAALMGKCLKNIS